MKIVLILLLTVTTLLFSQNKKEDEWLTKFEKSNYLETDRYDETIKYFQKLADYSEFAKLVTIGISPQGRELKCLIVSKDKIFIPSEAKKNKKAIILINNGIHSGEIEGKDASMLMLREMLVTKTKKSLPDNVVLLIIPVFNLDGYERFSKYNRINQNGPKEMGWRVTAQNYNLNRDFAKADTPEMKSLLRLYKEWLPDIFIDTHTTDGADYQYTITYGITRHQEIPPKTRKLVNSKLIPYFEHDVEKAGYLIMPYVGFIDRDYRNGIRDWVSTPRFSHSYAAAQNRIGILIETHMLKPYRERVFSTKVMLESIISFTNKNYSEIIKCSKTADEYVIKNYFHDHKAYPIKFDITEKSRIFNYKGIKYELFDSKISGSKIKRFTGEKYNIDIPYFNETKIVDSVYFPKAYVIPQEWKLLVDIMQLHGIEIKKIDSRTKYIVEKYKFENVKFATQPYESHFIPQFNYTLNLDTVIVNKGDYLIPTNQRSLGIIAYLLEPKSRESFVKWGIMNIIFERKEYFEDYSMEPIAQKMYDSSKKLKDEFDKKLNEDEKFKKNPRERLNFFYKHSPYYDKQYNSYPILRVIKKVK
jgi:hypothetical protein